MKEITVNQPKFVSEFRCVGNQCIDHCCQGWNIVLDKTTVNKYRKSSDINIRTIAHESIHLLKKDHAHWGQMKFNASGLCDFMSEDKLCTIHATMGAAALSKTCASYPRNQVDYKSEINKTLYLSCPEATRLLLTSPDAMQMMSNIQLQAKWNSNIGVDQHDRLLNLMAMHLINNSQAAPQQGLYAITLLLLFVEKHPQQIERLEAYFASLLEDLVQGNLGQQMATLGSNVELQWSLLARLQAYIATRSETRALSLLKRYVVRLLQLQTDDGSEQKTHTSMARLDQAWRTIAEPWLQAHPHIMRNYLMYRLYKEQFPNSRTRKPMSWLYLITAEWYLIKSLLTATAEKEGELSEKAVIDIIYSFHAVTKHNAKITAVFSAQIESLKMNDDLSLLYLLK